MAECKTKVLYRALLAEIKAGKYPPQGAFPSDHALERRFKVSRCTVRRAKKMLADQGLLAPVGAVGLLSCRPGRAKDSRLAGCGTHDRGQRRGNHDPGGSGQGKLIYAK
ncbi:MAG: GntR family transcriptional regulator [Kiritimatiellae bacterium]|nr:GntR family transcriptional regulator [Kiritimatiellia bacterium]